MHVKLDRICNESETKHASELKVSNQTSLKRFATGETGVVQCATLPRVSIRSEFGAYIKNRLLYS